MGEAPWGCIWKSWPEIVVVTQPPHAVDGAPYAQEYGCGQTGHRASGRNRRRLHDRRAQSMGKSAHTSGLKVAESSLRWLV
jgi:hypothetical protein